MATLPVPMAQTGSSAEGSARSCLDVQFSDIQATTIFLPLSAQIHTSLIHSLPVILGDDIGDSLELFLHDLLCNTAFSLLEGLTNTGNDGQTGADRSLDLVRDDLVRVAEHGSSLGVTEDGPVDIRVLELVGGDFSGESTGSLGEAVLGRNLDWLLESFLNLEEVESWGGDDDLCSGSVMSEGQSL